MADRKIYIHTDSRQLASALVARHTLKRNSRRPERFDVEIIAAGSFPILAGREGMTYTRAGESAVWCNDDPRSFAPLRFAVPEIMEYQGRAVVITPDVFALGDINELLDADMDGAAILARRIEADARRPLHFASSVMLLDCAQLRHWSLERGFGRIFTRAVDYHDWMGLLLEPHGTVGTLAPAWNDFDHLTPATRLLHGTQDHFFFRMLSECLELGSVTEQQLRQEIERQHLGADTLERIRAARGLRVVHG